MDKFAEEIEKVCREVLAPLIKVDGGELYLVAVSPQLIRLHLAGAYSGCPGSPIAHEEIVVPALKRVAGNAEIALTVGWIIPPGAQKMGTDT